MIGVGASRGTGIVGVAVTAGVDPVVVVAGNVGEVEVEVEGIVVVGPANILVR